MMFLIFGKIAHPSAWRSKPYAPSFWLRCYFEETCQIRQLLDLPAWVIARLAGVRAVGTALHYVAPVGEKEDYIARAMRNVEPYLATETQVA
jgi:hypothetical protein